VERKYIFGYLKGYQGCQGLREQYLRACLTVRAKMVRKAENHAWSSAAGHCGLKADNLITAKAYWQKQFESIKDWSSWLAEGENIEELMDLRRNVDKGLPCGSESFIRKLERLTGRSLIFRPQGRPKKDNGDE
jgi:putative transposase